MTRMQIIAKAVLTFIGISAFVYLCSNLSTLISPTRDISILQGVLFPPLFIILLIAIAHLLIFKNGWLARKMAGSGEELNSENEALWLAGSLQMVAVLYGLILLANSMPTILNIIVSPLYILPLINEIITFRAFPKSLAFTPYQWSYMIRHFLEAILALYLLYGWPQFIRFQLNIHKTKPPLNQNLHTEGFEK